MKVKMHDKELTLVGKTIAVGDKAPEFYVFDKEMMPVTLNEFKQSIVIINSFPSADTSVCSLQLQRFNQITNDMGPEVATLGISCDLPFAIQRYTSAGEVSNIHMLTDYYAIDFGLKYGLLIRELRLLTRSVIVLDRKRDVHYVEVVPEVSTEPQYDKAISAILEVMGQK